MGEVFDVLNDKGEKTGEIKGRKLVHRDGALWRCCSYGCAVQNVSAKTEQNTIQNSACILLRGRTTTFRCTCARSPLS